MNTVYAVLAYIPTVVLSVFAAFGVYSVLFQKSMMDAMNVGRGHGDGLAAAIILLRIGAGLLVWTLVADIVGRYFPRLTIINGVLIAIAVLTLVKTEKYDGQAYHQRADAALKRSADVEVLAFQDDLVIYKDHPVAITVRCRFRLAAGDVPSNEFPFQLRLQEDTPTEHQPNMFMNLESITNVLGDGQKQPSDNTYELRAIFGVNAPTDEMGTIPAEQVDVRKAYVRSRSKPMPLAIQLIRFAGAEAIVIQSDRTRNLYSVAELYKNDALLKAYWEELRMR